MAFSWRFTLSPSKEPVYGGKAVNQWLDAGYEDCVMAVQEIGPAAGPYILVKLAQEDSRFGTAQQYRAVWNQLPPFLRTAFPKPHAGNFDEGRASSILMELGRPVIPLLANHLDDKNPAVRIACARVLGSFGQRGVNIASTVPALRKAARDSNPEVAILATAALNKPATLIVHRP